MAAANLLAGVSRAAPPDAREPRGVRAGRLIATLVRRTRAGHPGRSSGLRRERHGSKGWRRAGPIVGWPRLDARGTLEHVPQGGATCLQPSPAPRTRARHPLRWPRIRRPVGTVRRTHRLALMLPLALALSAALAAAMLAALAPSPALAGTSLDARCDGVVLRSKPASSAHREGRLPQDARVVATTRRPRRQWHTQCGGASPRAGPGNRVVNVKARPRRSSTARRPSTGPPPCSTRLPVRSRPPAAASRLRTSPKATAPTKTRLPAGRGRSRRGTVPGGAWTFDCGGSKSGNGWYRITASTASPCAPCTGSARCTRRAGC